MSRAELIYPIRKRIAAEVAKAENDPLNKDVLTRYYRVRSTAVSLATVLTEVTWLNVLSGMLGKKFEDATIRDIEELIFKMEQRGNADTTQNRTRTILRCFYQWLRGLPKGEYPPEVKWIKMKKVPPSTITADDLIPLDEVIRISECTDYLRDKALVQGKLPALMNRFGDLNETMKKRTLEWAIQARYFEELDYT